MLTVEIRPIAVGRTSYTMTARLLSPVGETQASVKTVHACIDPSTGRPRPLPDDLRAAIAAHVSGPPPAS
jgi:acyl-CoA thioesterase FadM